MIHEHSKKQQRIKKSQHNDTKFWKLVSSRTCENWESWQNVCDMRELKMCDSHAYFEHDSQTDNNNENTEQWR